ncbi:unnamed protein product [Brassica rapa subsp. narinosa]
MAGPELYFEKFLGKGSFGSVSLYKYKRRHDGKTLYAAAKTSDHKHAESLYIEFQILSELKGCPRIVQCYGTEVLERRNEEGCLEYKIHMEYAPGGSLKSFSNQFEDKKLPDALVRDFTRMLLEGLATIHGRGYVHCDLKPANILIFPSYINKNGAWRSSHELKISDFGLTRRDGDTSWWQPHHPFAGTAIYMSPESISHGETGKGLDLWSLGCIVLEMYTGQRPWWHTDYKLNDLKNCHGPLIPRDLPFDAKLFLMTCFSPEADDRKDASTLVNHIFLRGDVVSKITESSPMSAKTGSNPRNITLELEKLRQRLSDMRSIFV